MWIREEQNKAVTSQKLEVDFHFKDDDNLSVTDEGGQNYGCRAGKSSAEPRPKGKADEVDVECNLRSQVG